MCQSGVFRIDVFCSDYRCNHSTTLPADRWRDHVRLSDIEPHFVCNACGKRGADVRPNFRHAATGTGGRSSVLTASRRIKLNWQS
jgi:hypothetical protein